jgi:hypothetical protein
MESISSTIALLQLRGEQQALHEFWWCSIGSQNVCDAAVAVHLPFVMCVKVWRAPQMVAVMHPWGAPACLQLVSRQGSPWELPPQAPPRPRQARMAK